MFDYYLLPMRLEEGQDQADLQGLLIAELPRRLDRTRTNDRLVGLFNFGNNPTFMGSSQSDMLQHMVNSFYRTRGPVTTALRIALETLNEDLFALAKKSAAPLVRARVTLTVVRTEILYLAVSGGEALWISRGETQEIAEHDVTVPTIGSGTRISVRYFQAEIQPGDLLVTSVKYPDGWSADLGLGSHKYSMESLRRRLISRGYDHLEVVITQFQPGKGEFHRLKPRTTPSPGETILEDPGLGEKAVTGILPTTKEPITPPVKPVAPPVKPVGGTPSNSPAGSTEEQVFAGAVYIGKTQPSPPSVPTRTITQPVPGPDKQPSPIQEKKPIPVEGSSPSKDVLKKDAVKKSESPAKPSSGNSDPLKKSIARVYFAVHTFWDRFVSGSRKFTGRMLPQSDDQLPGISPGTMLFIAIAVPLMVVAVAVSVYLFAPSGRSEQRQAYLLQAQTYANQATDQKDITLKRNALEQAMVWLDKAEENGKTDASRTLRTQVLHSLDEIEGVFRLDFQPATPTGFASTANFTEIASNQTEIYLLDSTRGHVLRLFLAGSTYEVDSEFNCAPGASGAIYIGPILDIAIVPPNPNKVGVLGIDGSGNVILCSPGQAPLSQTLPPPDNGWGQITDISMDQNILYILDGKNNAVWRYTSEGDNITFDTKPRLYFDSQIPKLDDVIDLAALGENLFLLHKDGGITQCTYRSAIQDTVCENGKYGDQRQGRSSSVKNFPEANFTHIQATQPPDPSLYLLDEKGNSIYHLSLRLKLQHILEPLPSEDYPALKGHPSGFNISPARLAIMAYGNQVFVANLP